MVALLGEEFDIHFSQMENEPVIADTAAVDPG